MLRFPIIAIVALTGVCVGGCGRSDPMPGRHVLAVNAWTTGRISKIDFDDAGRPMNRSIDLPIRAPITQLTLIGDRLFGLVPQWPGEDEVAGLYEIDIAQRKLRLIADLSEHRDHGGLEAHSGRLWTLVRTGLIVHDIETGRTRLIQTGPVQTQLGLASTGASVVFLSSDGRLLRCDPRTEEVGELTPGSGERFNQVAGCMPGVVVAEVLGDPARPSIIRDPYAAVPGTWQGRLPSSATLGRLMADGRDAWILCTNDLSNSTTMIRVSDGRREVVPTWVLSGVIVPD